MKHMPRRVSDTRELSDKELNQISSAMGDSVRLRLLASDFEPYKLKIKYLNPTQSCYCASKTVLGRSWKTLVAPHCLIARLPMMHLANYGWSY